jgi:hypothetical protein
VTEQHSPTRRKVVRAGVWSVPAVAVATAAPAFAAVSPTTGELKFDTNGVDVVWDNSGHKIGLHFRVEVQNVWVSGGHAVDPIQLTISIPDARVSGVNPTKLAGAGWSFATVTHSAGQYVYTFLHVGSVALGGNTAELNFDLPLADSTGGQFDVAFLATGDSVSPATGAATVHL